MQPCTSEVFLRAKMRHLELQLLLCSSGAALVSAQLVLNATRASMHGFERLFFARSLGLEAVRSACEDRASVAFWSSEKCPFALHTSAFCNCAERSSLYAMRAYMHAFGRSLFCMDHFTLKFYESHAKTAHQSLVISLNTVPLPVACRSAFCCCCEVILFHTPQRRTCTVVDAVFCMDRFSLNLIEAHAKTSRR